MFIFYQNVNRIRTKLKDVYLSILNSNYDIICLTETNFNQSVLNGEVFDDRYQVFRRDRSESGSRKVEGGGIAIAIKKCYTVARQANWESSIEDFWLTLIPTDDCLRVINVYLCYLPPIGIISTAEVEAFYDNLQNIIIS